MRHRLHRLLLVTLVMPTLALAEPSFDPGSRILTLPVLNVGDEEYRDIELSLGKDGRWSVVGGPTAWTGAGPSGTISDTCGAENITKERFAAVQFGMSFDDAIATVGCRGELVAEGMEGDAHFKAYHFEHGISNFDLWFKDGKVANKRQTIYEGGD
jgi:hypothetical protein